VDLKTNVSHWSDEVAAIHEMPAGYSPKVEDGIRFYAPEWREKITEVFTACAQKGISYDEEMEIITFTGKRKWVRTIGQAVRDENGAIFEVHGAFQDITERKQHQEKIENLNSLLLSVRNVNQIIVQEKDIHKIMEKSCEILHEARGYMNFEIALYDNNDKQIRPIANSGVNGLRKWHISSFDKGNAPKCVQQVVSLQKPFVIKEPIEYCQNCPFFEEDIEYQTILIPMLLNGECSGILTASLMPDKIASKEEIDLLLEVASDLAFARQKHIADKLLNYTLLRYQELFERSRDGLVVCDKNRKIVDANKSFCKMLGYSLPELTKLESNEEITPERWHKIEREIWDEQVIKRSYSDVYEKEYIRKNGRVFPIEIRTFAVYDNDGNLENVWGIVRDIGERKEFDNKLLQKTELLENISENMFDMVALTDLQGNFTFLGKSHEQMGYSPEDLLGENVMAKVHPDDIQALQTKFAEFLQTKSKQRTREEYRYRRSDGNYIWLETVGKILFDENNKPKELIFSSRDVTERKQTEDKFKESDRVFNHSIDMLCIAGFDGYFKKLNPAWEKTLGWSTKELLSKPWIDFTHPDDIEKTKNIKSVKLDNGEEVYQFENRYICKDGTIKWLSWNSFPFPEDSVMFGVARDITKQKKAEEQLKESEEKYRRITENISDVIWMSDMNLKTTYVSKSVEKLVGESIEAHLQKSIEERIPAESLSNLIANLQEELEKENDPNVDKNRSRIFETKHYKADGSEIWISMNISFIRDEKGNPIGLQGVTRDITQRKLAEEEAKKRENFLNEVFEILPIGLWFADKNGKLLRGNPAGIKIWGAEPKVPFEEYGVFKARRLPSGEEIQPHDWALAHTIQEKVTISDELLEIDAFDGKKKIILNYTAPVLDDNGEILGAIVVNNDITEKKQAEEELIESEERFKALHNASFGGIAIHDKGIILEVNQGMSEMTGYSYEELVSMDGLLLIAEESREMVMQNIVAGYEKPYEAIGLRRNGETYPLLLEARNIHYKGKPVRTVEFRDVTEQKKAEERLKESEEKYRFLVTHSHDLIWILKMDGIFTYVSPSWKDILGYEPAYMIGKAFQPFVYPDDVAECENYMLQAFNAQKSFPGPQYRVKHADGSWRWHEGNITPVFAEDGTFLNFVGISRDITERKQAEEEIKLLLEEKHLLLQETHHRIKNNMAVVQSLLSLQAKDIADELSRAILQDAARRVQSMVALYNRLYRSEIKRELSLQVFLPPLIDEIVKIFEKNVAIQPQLQLEDIVLNSKILVPLGIIFNECITNSVKHAFKDGKIGVITIIASTQDDKVVITYDDGETLVEPISFANSENFGLKLIYLMVKQLKGEIRTGDEKCKYVIEFPN
jgi:PAS domain S-box-containing protein